MTDSLTFENTNEAANTSSYNPAFYDRQVSTSYTSACAILRILFEYYKPDSVIDVGSGRGAWLAAAESLGCKTLTGYDGPWAKKLTFVSTNIDFRPVDLESDFQIDGFYDLAISVEVAEHLSEGRAAEFVRKLCHASNVIVFGAAIEGQGGVNHINEKPQSYWIRHFKNNGFEAFDIFRNAVWNNDSVNFWYRQNTFLFVNRNEIQFDPGKFESSAEDRYDVVHPLLLAHKDKQINMMKNRPTLSFCVNTFKRYLRNKLKN